MSDLLVVLSLLALGIVLVYPGLKERAFTGELNRAVEAVETLRSAASAFFGRDGDWPAPNPAGVLPPELATALPFAYSLTADGYSLEGNRWETVERPGVVLRPEPLVLPRERPGLVPRLEPLVASEEVEPRDSVAVIQPPRYHTTGGITVHASDPALLAGLLRHFGTRLSFVRDTTWTLVIPQRSGPRPVGSGE